MNLKTDQLNAVVLTNAFNIAQMVLSHRIFAIDRKSKLSVGDVALRAQLVEAHGVLSDHNVAVQKANGLAVG